MNNTLQNWHAAILNHEKNIGEVIENLDHTGLRIVLVTNKDGVFEGTISDGDVRRGLLRGLDMRSPLSEILHRNALIVPPEMGLDLVKQLMMINKIHQIPVVNEGRHIVGLYLWDDIIVAPVRNNSILIMAGGVGKRLRPHTENCPKPMLELAGKPMLEHIINRAKLEGFNHFIIAIHYLGHMIESYFNDGDRLGVRIDYLRETSPLGTAGALSLLNPIPNDPFIVINGDVITDIRYSEILDFHMRHSADATMAVRIHEWQNPFGVVQTIGANIVAFEEKPIIRSHINAGVYVINPTCIDLLVKNEYCDMPSLFERLQAKQRKAVAYPMHEPWLDVGRPDDLVAARLDMERNSK